MPSGAGKGVHAAPANVLDWRDRVSAFDDVAMLNEFIGSAVLTGRGDATNVQIGAVSGNLFSVLGVRPTLGRPFTFDETWAEAAPVVILGHGIWQRQFGGDPGVVGSALMLDGLAHEVVGVMPAGFRYAFNDAEMWVPYRWSTQRRESIWFRQAHVTRVVARLGSGVTPERARAELETVASQLRQEYPELNRMMDAGLTPLHQFLVGDTRLPLLLLMGAVGLLQLIACTNIANLLLARSVDRRQEMAVRTALGAGRLRIASQLLTESGMLAAAGALLGIGLADLLVRWTATLPWPGWSTLAVQIDWRVLVFTLVVAVGSALAFGFAPIARLVREEVTAGLGDGSRGASTSRGQQRAAGTLTALQVAFALMLVIAAGLMVRTLAELSRVDTGGRRQQRADLRHQPTRGNLSDRSRPRRCHRPSRRAPA